MRNGKAKAILYALSAAVFYAVNVPMSKMLLAGVEPTTMAALVVMIFGTWIVVADTLMRSHDHHHARIELEKEMTSHV